MIHTPDLLRIGATAVKQGQYNQAIEPLEQFCKDAIDRRSKAFFQAQMWLVRAYKEVGDRAQAVAVCQQLANSDFPQVQQWANKVLPQLASVPQANISERPPVRQSVPRQQTTPTRQSPSPQPVKAPGSKDLTPQIMSVVCHGSISMLTSFILWVLFPDSAIASALGLVRLAVPITIFATTQDNLVKANAREATNYVITVALYTVIALLCGFTLISGMIPLWLITIPLLILMAIMAILQSIWAVVGTLVCLLKPNHIFRYPKWLIWHFV